MCTAVLALCDSAVETQDPLPASTLPTKSQPTLAKPGFQFSFLACYLFWLVFPFYFWFISEQLFSLVFI